jgi:hypothetical protein
MPYFEKFIHLLHSSEFICGEKQPLKLSPFKLVKQNDSALDKGPFCQ